MTPYKPVPLKTPSLLQRLFKQQPPENAIIQVNNLLAEKPLQSITQNDLQNIESQYPVNLKQEYALNLQEFYAVYWNHSLLAGPQNAQTESELQHLAQLFQFSTETLNQLHHQVGAARFRKAAAGALKKRRFTPEDQGNLEHIRQRLKLGGEAAAQILSEEKLNTVDSFTTAIIKRNRCTPDEYQEFNAIKQSLQPPAERISAIGSTLKTLNYYWELEHLPMQTVNTRMVLQKSEACYYQLGQVKWLETRNDRYGTARYEVINIGSLCLTNKRLLFEGNQKNSNIPYDRIRSVSAQSNGVLIQKDKGKDPILEYQGDKLILEILLKRILKEMKGFELR
jgi:hypothetical protein